MAVSHSLRTPVQIGSLLQGARKAKKMTQTDLAARVGLSQSRLSYLESHPGELSVNQLLLLAAALGVDLQIGMRDAGSGSSPPGEDW